MSPSTAEFAIVVIVFALTLGWALRRFRRLRYAAAVVVLANAASFVFAEDAPAVDTESGDQQPSDAASGDEASEKAAEPAANPADEGGRNWGSDDGIATTLQPKSKIVLGIGFVITLGLVIWLVSYQKPDGAAYPDNEG